MIYTLTLNPAVDKTVIIPNFVPGTVNRIESVRTDIGGKGINVSKCLHRMGCDSTAVAFFGGETGIRAAETLEQSGIRTVKLSVAGEMRTNLKIIDPVLGQNTDINEPGPAITRENMSRLAGKLDTLLTPGDILILSGSIPGGVESTVYRELIFRYHSKKTAVFLDADGEPLRLALGAGPELIKPNREELSRLTGAPLQTKTEILNAAQALLQCGVGTVLVSLGADGALLVRGDGVFCARGLSVPVHSTVGAGDSMVAAMAYAAQNGLSAADSLRLAVAISAASVMQTGTQPPEPNLIGELYRKVQIES